jgi:two-component system sensor histidine kinase/response regulator
MNWRSKHKQTDKAVNAHPQNTAGLAAVKPPQPTPNGAQKADPMQVTDSTQPRPKPQRTPLAFIIVFAVLALCIILSGFFYYRGYERKFRLQVEGQLKSIADQKVSEIVQWRKELLGDGSILFNNPHVTTLVKDYYAKPQNAVVREELLAYMNAVMNARQYDRVSLLDTKGLERLSTSGTLGPAGDYLQQRLPEVLRTGKVAILDFYRDTPDEPIYLAVLVPITDGKAGGNPLGMLVLRVVPDTYIYPLIQRWPIPSKTAETLLIRKDGSDALYLNNLRFSEDAALSLRIPLSRVDVPAVAAVQGKEGVTEGVDYRGVPVVAYACVIPDSPWFITAKMDKSEIYAPLREQGFYLAIVVFLFLFAAGAGILLVARMQNVRFKRGKVAPAKG